MRKYFMPVMMILISFCSYAQDQYVEVIVRDTLLAEPQRWTVYVNLHEVMDYTITTEDSVTVDSSPMKRPVPEKKGRQKMT
jgi:hypothetical protein